VGPHVDVSNEAGPQSETSIAINPSDQSQIVAASNEIFRVPMRGYFSAIGGSSWGGVDPAAAAHHERTDFGSDPSVTWDAHRCPLITDLEQSGRHVAIIVHRL